MKHTFLSVCLFAGVLLVSCNTTKKLYEAQEYDQVILKAAPRICDGRSRPEEVRLTIDAYHKSNQADHERIMSLKATGQPDVWPEIYERYTSMNGREQALECLPTHLIGPKLDLSDELTNSKNKAEAYLTAKINQLLASETPTDIDQAKRLTRQLMHINPDHAQIGLFQMRAMLRQAPQLTTEFDYGDRRHPLPIGFEDMVMTFDEEELAKFPLGISNTVYPAKMIVEVTDFIVTPNKEETVTFKETKDNLTATVTDHVLSKTATVKADVTFLFKDRESITGSEWNVVKLEDFVTSSNFNYTYTTVEGSQEACSEQTLENLKHQIIPFPTDESLLLDAAKELNDLIAKTLSE